MLKRFETEVRSLEEWRQLKNDWPLLFKDETAAAIAQEVSRSGLVDPIEGFVDPSQITIGSDNYRETITALGTNSRQRAVILLFQQLTKNAGTHLQVYASEAISPLAKRMSSYLDFYTGSEYLPTSDERKLHPDVLHQDIMDMSFENAQFDIYLSCDVLEHVPDITQAVREAFRILKPGGIFLGTVPFASERQESVVRATLEEGAVVHHMEAQYHGNPTKPDEGSLVFQVPGWGFFDQCKEIGFSDAYMQLMLSSRHGIASKSVAFIMTFVAIK